MFSRSGDDPAARVGDAGVAVRPAERVQHRSGAQRSGNGEETASGRAISSAHLCVRTFHGV